MIPPKYCKQCNHKVRVERHKKRFDAQYLYYCPHCDENMFRCEVWSRREWRETKDPRDKVQIDT